MNPIFWDILSEKQTYKIGYFISSVCILVVIVCWDRLLGYYWNSKLLPRLKYIFVKSCIVSFMALCFDITAVTRTICFFPLTVFSRFVSFIISWEAFFLEIIADTMSLARISVHWWDEVFLSSHFLFFLALESLWGFPLQIIIRIQTNGRGCKCFYLFDLLTRYMKHRRIICSLSNTLRYFSSWLLSVTTMLCE